PAAGTSIGDGAGDMAATTAGEAGACEAVPPRLGRRLYPTTATTRTAAAAITHLTYEFMSEALHAGHQGRRCRVDRMRSREASISLRCARACGAGATPS